MEVQIAKFMQAHGWRRRRNHVGSFRPVHGAGIITIGKEGDPDFSYFRTVKPGLLQVLHVEVKKPGEKPRPKQVETIASLNHVGETAIWADSIESLISQYQNLGLNDTVSL